MKKAAFLLFAFVLFFFAVPVALLIQSAHAEGGSCYNIADPDARSYCIARERREPSACYNIQRSDYRAQCLADARK